MSLLYGQDIPLDTLISVAADAARQAGAILAECTRTGFRIEHKQIINLVTDADHQAEQRIIDVIHDASQPIVSLLRNVVSPSNLHPATNG